jgi:fructose-1,6-bisphosphatase/inositol monophosphatase family enzyme
VEGDNCRDRLFYEPMTFSIELEPVAAIIRGVAEQEILPRFQRLEKHEIREKSPGSLVTIADTEAERALHAELTRLLPGSLVLGEEGAAADPTVFDHLETDQPVWIIDPVDGTINFARSLPRFAVIVALVAGGDVRAGWIHDPVRHATAMAKTGGGAWLVEAGGEERRLERRAMPPVRKARGAAAGRFPGGKRALDILKESGRTGPLHRVTSAAHEYLDLVEGRVDFATFGRVLPWDHAAGVLIHREAGGVSGFVEADTERPVPYSPRRQAGLLLLTPAAEPWAELRDILVTG